MGLRATMRSAIINTNSNHLPTLLRTIRRLISTTNAIRRTVFHISVRISRVPPRIVIFTSLTRIISSYSVHSHVIYTDDSDFFVQYSDPSLLANKSGRTRDTIGRESKFSDHLTTTYYDASNEISDTFYSYGGQVTFEIYTLTQTILPELTMSRLI